MEHVVLLHQVTMPWQINSSWTMLSSFILSNLAVVNEFVLVSRKFLLAVMEINDVWWILFSLSFLFFLFRFEFLPPLFYEQEQQIMKGVKEMKQRHMVAFLNAIEKGVGRKLRERELEIGNMNRKNKELIERIKQVAMEAQSWQFRARYNESVVNMLKISLKQAIAHGANHAREGCGDSEGDDAVSSYNPSGVVGGNLQSSVPGNKRMISRRMACKSCKLKEVSVLLIPCRHLCLCHDCDIFIEVCPVCQTMKSVSVPVYMA